MHLLPAFLEVEYCIEPMNSQIQQELQTAIRSNVPLDQIVALLRKYKADGITQREVYSFLDDWRRAGPDEATDDRILEVADFVAGFCAAPMKVWDGQNL